MIDCADFYRLLKRHEVAFFTGVPDSLLKHFCAYIADHCTPDRHVIAANEGGALALAIGYHLAGGQIPLVYLQNAGLGNLINPLLSLSDKDVYAIPALLLIGWRGCPGVADEPQHRPQGRVTPDLLKVLGVESAVIGADTTPEELDERVSRLITGIKKQSAPTALVVKPKTFAPYARRLPVPADATLPSRDEMLAALLPSLPKRAKIVATTGYLSRALFDYRERMRQSHAPDFLVVGGMGHAGQIAWGLARHRPETPVYCLDGDGSLLMHMGGMAISGVAKLPNFQHIVFNNGVHESVGGQPTVARQIRLTDIAGACGYGVVQRVRDTEEVADALHMMCASRESGFLEIMIRTDVTPSLGRPTHSPREGKALFIRS